MTTWTCTDLTSYVSTAFTDNDSCCLAIQAKFAATFIASPTIEFEIKLEFCVCARARLCFVYVIDNLRSVFLASDSLFILYMYMSEVLGSVNVYPHRYTRSWTKQTGRRDESLEALRVRAIR